MKLVDYLSLPVKTRLATAKPALPTHPSKGGMTACISTAK
jgi:hypothetical protein